MPRRIIFAQGKSVQWNTLVIERRKSTEIKVSYSHYLCEPFGFPYLEGSLLENVVLSKTSQIARYGILYCEWQRFLGIAQ